MENRKVLKLVMAIFIGCLVFGSWHDIAFMKTKQTCGEITEATRGVRNHCYLKYSFKISSKTYYREMPCNEIKSELTLDSLKKIKCIKVEYSLIDKSYTRIIDDRILK